MNYFLIPPEKILQGLNLTLQYSIDLLNSSGNLFNNKKFQASISLAVLAYEEAAKANWLLKKFEEKSGITKEEWKSLRTHSFKHTELEKDNLEKIDDMSDAEMKIYLNFQEEKVPYIAEHSREDAINKRKMMLAYLDKFDRVKQTCFYSNWNEGKGQWESIHRLSKDEQYALNYCVLHYADNLFLRVVFMKDLHENPAKSAGIKEVKVDIEKNEIILLDDYEEDVEKRESFQRLKSHFEDSKKYEPLLAKGLWILKKYF